MQLQAFAKINLDLRVLGLREDGYHDVRTILQTIDWADEIQIGPSDRFEFVEHGMEAREDNLVVRAVRVFEDLTGEVVRARIELFKRVPPGAGLGGGSADAAVTLLGLQRLHGREIAQQELLHALGRIGSDVPFFALGGKALGIGRGDEIVPIEEDSEYALVVVVPPVSIVTRDAYSWLTVSDKSNIISRFCAQPVSASGEDGPRNDFESVVLPRYPVLREIQNEILKTGAERAALSGTGSAIFGIYRSREEATKAALTLLRFGTVKVTRPLSRAEYLRGIWGVAKW
jgi:4-diphosphocytidyl-2-C-methyl-D-erythritol kinase